MFRFVVCLLVLSAVWGRHQKKHKIHKLKNLHHRAKSICTTEGGECGDNTLYDCVGVDFEEKKCGGGPTTQCCSSAGVLTIKPIAEALQCPDFDAALTSRQKLMVSAQALFDKWSVNGIYTQEGNPRWTGIHEHKCPPDAPQKSDCSSAVTWIYWTVFGQGPDFLNAQTWSAGYTGTLSSHGARIECSDVQPGDLCFYGTSASHITHVNMYIGDGQCVDHGSQKVKHVPIHTPVLCKRYIPLDAAPTAEAESQPEPEAAAESQPQPAEDSSQPEQSTESDG